MAILNANSANNRERREKKFVMFAPFAPFAFQGTRSGVLEAIALAISPSEEERKVNRRDRGERGEILFSPRR